MVHNLDYLVYATDIHRATQQGRLFQSRQDSLKMMTSISLHILLCWLNS